VKYADLEQFSLLLWMHLMGYKKLLGRLADFDARRR
jgi:hypothetical protein